VLRTEKSRGHDHFVHTQLTSRFMHLAIGMAFDLRLNKPPLKDPYFVLDVSSTEGEKEQAHASTRTMEERRAILCCFVLSSLYALLVVFAPKLIIIFCRISWYFKKIDPLRWTPYMEECLLALISSTETPADQIFAHEVQLQLITQRTFESSNSHPDRLEDSRTPLPFYLKVFQSQLLDVQRSLSPQAECNGKSNSPLHYLLTTY
jgi:hypothetical protein